MFGLASLIFFTAASAGFLFFTFRYPRKSGIRLWGLRLSYLLGFFGVLMQRLSWGYFTELSVLIASILAISLLTFELAARLLK